MLKLQYKYIPRSIVEAATFGWLCVETLQIGEVFADKPAATFGWLCVETLQGRIGGQVQDGSHLRVAVC